MRLEVEEYFSQSMYCQIHQIYILWETSSIRKRSRNNYEVNIPKNKDPFIMVSG